MPALPPQAQQKPFTQEQVSNMVRDGFGDDSGAKLIEHRGIDFAPAEDFIQTLKAAGASEAFLNALRAAVAPGLSPAHAALKGASTTAGPPASAKKPLNQVQVFALLVGQVPSHRVTMLVEERGIDFEPTDDYLQEVRLAGGEDELISALKTAKVTKPATVDPAAQVRQTEIRQHVARGAEFMREKRYTDAEVEYRAAVRLDPQSPYSHADLGAVLRLKGDIDGAIAEYREAVRLNPKDDEAYTWLGAALGSKEDWDGEVSEEREALRLNPDNENAHMELGIALGIKGDADGEIAEFHEVLRLDPNYGLAHLNLGLALGRKGDWEGDIAEQREVLRLHPNDDAAHNELGVALGKKGDWDGDIAEQGAALRLDPNNANAHYALGVAFEAKADPQGALREYRAAYEIYPQITAYRQAYDRLLKARKP
jgi:tetratricopeptide (TPR) repeat protein